MRSRAIGHYGTELDNLPPLSKEEEYELAVKAKGGDVEARNKMVSHNLRFCLSIATGYQNNGLSLDELISYGHEGIMKAAGRFEPDKGFKFISYAVWWIRQSILGALKEHRTDLPARIPCNVAELATKVRKLEDRGNSRPEIAELLGVTLQKVETALAVSQGAFWIDRPVGSNSSGGVVTTFNDLASYDNPMGDGLKDLLEEEQTDAVHAALDGLKSRERHVLMRVYGLHNGGDGDTLQSIATDNKITRERVRQIKESALEKLRHRANLKKLKAVFHPGVSSDSYLTSKFLGRSG